MANYFYDTEFLEGTQEKKFLGFTIGKTKPTIDLISIGIVAEDGREYYAISKDFNLKEAWNRFDLEYRLIDAGRDKKYVKVYWIRENVLLPIFYELALQDFHLTHFKDEWYHEQNEVTYEYFKNSSVWRNNLKWFRKLLNKYGKTNSEIAKETRDFIMETGIDYGIGPHQYTPVNLYGYYSAYDHVVFFWLFGKMINLPTGFPMYTKDLKQILDEKAVGRMPVSHKENIYLLKQRPNYPQQEKEHSAIFDARWNKKLHEFLKSI